MTTENEKWACRMYGESIRTGQTYSFEQTFALIKWVRRLARKYGRLMEKQCNEKLTKRDERDIAAIEEKIPELIGLLFNHQPNTGVVFQQDPRGYTVKIKLPSGYKDDMGLEGFCVPGA